MTESEYIYETIKTWIPVPDWRKMREEGDFLILLGNNLEMHFLNTTAREIVEQLGSKTIAEICDYMLAEYDADEHILRHDCIHILRDLQWKHLIRVKR